MEPLSPISIPRYSSPNRGRSPAPRYPRPMLPPISPTAPPLFTERPESPELIFPMSPVLTDSKETAASLSPRRVLPMPQTRRSAPEPILIDLVLQPQLGRNKAPIQPHQDSKTTPLKAKSKLTGARPAPTAPKLQQKLRRQPSTGVRRLVEFLHPSLPSVMATPTAVTVRRSSQADGPSEFVMEEHTLPPLSDHPPSKPVQIKRSKFDQQRRDDYCPSSFEDLDEDLDLALPSLPKWPLDRTSHNNHDESRGSNESAMAPAWSRPRLSLRKFASHAHIRSPQHPQ